ncbi:KilA-N domain-containing protein [Belnapia sp. T18]|uniref:KilA-N domain-containing protein n=1 Tax=Belnapia arida TaxID=2804533 RepID=A0ABS1UC13_9PROT|nr:KilA-N domain-containing protein [Belnapia arida]MBL6081685.1 KilA-N domain-containing protein [Belnapia arida]
MLNLTDMWRAAGCPEYRRPIHWLVLKETTRFRTHAQTYWTDPDGPVSQNIIQDDIIRLDPDGFVATARGRLGGTWAHWQLALAYARYLSPEFHLWCNTVVRAALTGTTAGPQPTTIRCGSTFRGSSAPCTTGSTRSSGIRRT